MLRGGSGDDSLFGGAAAEPDTLFGEADDDRFLVRSDDVIADQTGDDAALAFEDVSSTWTDGEIEVFDLGFQRLQDRTGNTALLRDPLIPDLLTFYKYDDLGGSAGLNYLSWTSSTTCGPSGCNTTYVYTREIRIADWDENIPFYNDQFQSIAMHEIGHNWDSELELSSASPALGGLWNNFLTISDWQENYPGAGYTQSLDGNWWYLSTANFAENYGRNNPNEDFSTSLEYYFTEYQDPSLDHSDLQSKMDLLDALFDNLM